MTHTEPITAAEARAVAAERRQATMNADLAEAYRRISVAAGKGYTDCELPRCSPEAQAALQQQGYTVELKSTGYNESSWEVSW